MLNDNIIRPSLSPWNFPLIVVPKKMNENDTEKKWRLVIDYRRLNDVTVGEIFPLPNIQDILDQLSKSSYFSSLDLSNGYHQVVLKESDKIKTAFSTNLGHYEFNRMPFGLKNAPATFQRIMNNILTGLNSLQSFVYLDDVVVYGHDLKDHNKKLINILERFRQFNLKLNPAKCRFLRKEIVFLGHLVTENGVKPNPQLIEAIQKFPIPSTIKQVKSFLGLAGYYRRFIKDFSKITKPLVNLTKKNIPFVWCPFCDEAFNLLRSLLSNPPILKYPDFDQMFFLTCDASDIAIGAVLSQMHENQDLPIAFASRSLNSAENHYSTIEKELLAIVWAVKHYRPYLYGRSFTLITDHQPLTWLNGLKNPTSRLMRWRVELDEYDFVVKYKPGKQNVIADALSRIKIEEIPNSNSFYSSNSNSFPNLITNLPNCASSSKNNSNSFKQIQSSTFIPAITRAQTTKLNQVENEAIENIPDTSTDDKSIQIQTFITEIEDDKAIKKLLDEFHISSLGGHQGISRTYNRIKSYYHFPNMLSRIKAYIKSCPSCQKNKVSIPHKMPMVITTTSSKPFDRIFLDIVGPLNITFQHNRYILTIQDDLSKYSLAIPIENQESTTIAQAFVENYICRFGAPEAILTDQGTNLIGEVLKNVCKILKISKIQTTAYHPQSNGACERSHRTLAEYLRNFIDGDTQNWDTWIPFAMFTYNTTPHTSTHIMPFELIHGFKPNLPSSFKSKQLSVVYNYEDYLSFIKNRLKSSYEIARQNLLISKEKSKIYYDKNCNPVTFKIGDQVLLKNELKSKNKLDSLWHGPHLVVDIISNENTKIKVAKKFRVVHNNRLKLFNS